MNISFGEQEKDGEKQAEHLIKVGIFYQKRH
jgi:hypothetical protein